MIRSLVARIFSWAQAHPLAASLVVGLALRLIGIQSRSIHYDDTFSIFISERSLPEIVAGTAADTMPPLYYFLLHYWMLLSREIWFIRLLSVAISLLLIVILYRVVHLLAGRMAAGWAALLAAVSPLQIYHAQDIRMYALLVLGQLGYFWFFVRIWAAGEAGRQRWLDWAGLILFGLIAMYSHNLAVFALVVPGLLLLVSRRWKTLVRLVVALSVIGLGALPWLVYLPGQLEKIQRAFWTPRPGLVELVQAVIMFHASMPLPTPLLFAAALLSFQVLILVVIELWKRRAQIAGIGPLVALFLVPPALLFLVSYVMRPVFVPRGFLVSSMAYYGLAGIVIHCAWARGPGKLVLGGFVLAAALTLPSFYTFNDFPRSPFREAAAYLGQAGGSGALVIHETKLSYFPMRYYDPPLRQVFLADPPGSMNDTFAPQSQQAMQIFPQPDIETAAADYQDVYFITFSQTFRDYEAMGYPDYPNIRWLDDRFQLVDRVAFRDLEIFHYVR